MDATKRARIGADMDREAAQVRDIGDRMEISGMEAVALCNMAYLGCLSVFIGQGGKTGRMAFDEMGRFKEQLGAVFEARGSNGLKRLTQTATAILGQDRFQRYVVPIEG